MNEKTSLNLRYMLLQACYWMLICCGACFVSLYLQDKGLPPSAIGTVAAVFAGLSAVCQPLMGRLCDRFPWFTWKRTMLLLTVPFLVICLLMIVIPGPVAAALLLGLLVLLSRTAMSIPNTAHYYYLQKGIQLNFGVARGIGSGAYALTSLAIGALAAELGTVVVPAAGAIVALLTIAVTLSFPVEPMETSAAREKKAGSSGFFRRYPHFLMMLAAMLLIMVAHNGLATYLLQIVQRIGGDSANLGACMAIQAAVEIPVLFCSIRLVKRVGSEKLMIAAAAGYVLKAFLYAVTGSIPLFYAIQLTQMISYAFYASASMYYTQEVVAAEDQATGQAFVGSMSAGGTVLGSLIGGWVLTLADVQTFVWVCVGAAGCAVLLAVAAVVMGKKRANA